jgi:spoIIIJ-associated protein
MTTTTRPQAPRTRLVRALAEQAADEAVRSGRPVALAAMDDEERGLARERLRWRTDVAVRSEGEGPERHLVVIPI